MFVSDLVFLLVELACAAGHCVGMIYPNWWYVSEPSGNSNQTKTSYFGLWETITCFDNICSSTKSDMDGKRAWLVGVAVLESVSAALFVIALFVSIIFTIRGKENSLLRKLYVIAVGGAGTFVILAILIFVKKKAGLTKVMALETSDGDPGWPLILSSVSGSVAIVTSIAMVIKLCTRTKHLDEEFMDDPYYLREIERKINELKVSVEPYQRENSKEEMTKY